jgi:hypothetical protein
VYGHDGLSANKWKHLQLPSYGFQPGNERLYDACQLELAFANAFTLTIQLLPPFR